MDRNLRIGLVSAAVSVLMLATVPVFAQTGGPSANSRAEAHVVAADAAQQQAQQRKDEAQQKLCDTKKRVVSTIENRISKRGQNRIEVINTIAERVENFYQTKGLSVSSYDQLVAEVNSKQAAAQSAVDKVKADASDVSTVVCGQGKGVVEGFKGDLKSEIAALKAYQTSVKNLIVAVKSAQSTTTPATNGGGAQQ